MRRRLGGKKDYVESEKFLELKKFYPEKILELKKFYSEKFLDEKFFYRYLGLGKFYRYLGLPVPVQGYTVQG